MNTQITCERGQLWVRAPFALKDRCKIITGYAWDGARKQWGYPATVATAQALDRAFPGATWEATARAILEPDETHALRDVPPMPIKTTPWRHQQAAYEFALRERFANGGGGALIAMEMGTGKTAVAIALIGAVQAKCILISCPKSVVPVWPQQIALHAAMPMHVCALDRGSVERRAKQAAQALELARARDEPCVIVINHESVRLRPFYDLAQQTPWDAYIGDEIHRLRAPQGKQAQAVSLLCRRIPYRLGLSGTPLPHSPLDAYGIFRILDPSIFGTSYVTFRSRYAEMKEIQPRRNARKVWIVKGYRHLDELQAKMATATFRVLAKDVLDLPPVQHIYRLCRLTTGADVYEALQDGFFAEVAAGKVTPKNALAQTVRLRQATSGFTVTDAGAHQEIDTAKADLLADVLEDLPLREPVAVFGIFHQDLDVIRRVAEAHGRSVGELSGRKNDLHAWQAGDLDVLAVQMQSGGEGIDLTRGHFTIFYSLGSLGQYLQAVKRMDRPGQTRPVRLIYLLAEQTIDIAWYRALTARQEVVDAVLAWAQIGQSTLVPTGT